MEGMLRFLPSERKAVHMDELAAWKVAVSQRHHLSPSDDNLGNVS